MSREDPQFKLRLPSGLKERIDKAASDNRRSINAELIARLEATLLLDDLMEQNRMGSFQEAPHAIKALLRENSDFSDDAARFKRLVTGEFSRLLDERLDLLESRLLSLPGSAFGKSLKK